MLETVPGDEPALQSHVHSLKERFPDATGLTYEQLSVLAQFLGYWSLHLEDADTIFREPDRLRLNPRNVAQGYKHPFSVFDDVLRSNGSFLGGCHFRF